MWPKVRLGDACVKIGSGATPRGGAQVYVDSGISLIRSQNIYNGRFKYDGLTYITDDAASKLRNVTVCSGDVLLNITGDSVARCALVPENVLPARVNQHVSILRTNPSVLLPAYLQAALTEPFMQAYMIGLASGQGGSRNALTKRDIESFEIVLPPLPIQQKIADILGAYDDLIENNRRRIELLEKMARELYRERFVRRREGVFETRTLEQIGVRLESGSRPKGGVKDLDEGIPSVGAENVIGLGKYNYGSEKLISEDFYTKMRRGKIQDRDILLYKDGAYIGRVSLFQDGFPHKVAAVNEHVFLLHAEDEVIQYFLFFTLAQDKYFKIMQGLNENAAQPGLNQGSVYGLKIDLPDFEQIKQFNDIVSPLVSEIFSLSNQNRNLAKQRDRLLPRLMSGKLDVSKLVKEGV